MKKKKSIYIIIAIIVVSCVTAGAIAWISCANTTPEEQTSEKTGEYKADVVELKNQTDSVNYAFGLVNGAQIKMYYLPNDSTKEGLNELMNAIQNSYDGKAEELSEAALIGKSLAQSVKSTENVGLAGNSAWTFNENTFFQGFVNGLYGDSQIFDKANAEDFFMTQFELSATSQDTTKAEATITGQCPNTVKQIKLSNNIDSLNYAFGYLNGTEVVMYYLTDDSTHKMKQEVIAQINIELGKKIKYPELIDLGEQIGKSLKDQEQTGLIGISKLDCNYELIKQGLINGLLGEETQWNSDSAYEYFNQTLMSIQYGDSKKEGEDFLAENTKKEGVITTESGLQYEVIKMGDGKKPTANDNVKVHYHGTLIDGTVFDSSVQRGEPIIFALTQVISGWTEALQLMPVGSKFKLYIPSDLAYGAQQAGQIPPYSTLIFEVELLGIE